MFEKPRNAVIACLALALIVGLFVSGNYFYKMPIDMDPSDALFGVAIEKVIEAVQDATGRLGRVDAFVFWALSSLFAVPVLTFFVVRASVRGRDGGLEPGRRHFLKGAGAGLGAGFAAFVVSYASGIARGLYGFGRGVEGWIPVHSVIYDKDEVIEYTHKEWKEEWKGSGIANHRRLGRTEWMASDIVFGSARINLGSNPAIVRQALERGVNYIDTAPCYWQSEKSLAPVIRGLRDEIFIATKLCTEKGHLPAGTSVAKYMEAAEGSLRRLQTDHLDLVHVHCCDRVDRLLDPNVHEAFDRLKEQGKARFLGFSTHTPNLIDVASAGIDSGRFDVMMLAYHHGLWAPLDELIARARSEQDMGVVAMKTLKGAKHHGLAGFRDEANSYAQAALRWTLSNEDVSCAVISFFELQHADEYLAASGGRVSDRDVAVLNRYDQLIHGTHCAPHCGACLSSCPEELAIHDILRHRMYFEDYRQEKEGMQLYAALDKQADVCAGCSAPCVGTCPSGIPIQERLLESHDLLTLRG